MPLYYHSPPVAVDQPVLAGQPSPPPLFYHAAPHLVDPSPDAQIPPGAPVEPLPYGASHVGPSPPPGCPGGGYWSQHGFFPVSRDAIPASVPQPVILPTAMPAIPPPGYHVATADGKIRSFSSGSGMTISIAVPCATCGHGFYQENLSQDSCRPCRRIKRRARITQEIMQEELESFRKEQAEAWAKLREEEKNKEEQKLKEEAEAKARAVAYYQQLEYEKARHAAEQEALRKLTEEAATQKIELEATRKRTEELARQLAEAETLRKYSETMQKDLQNSLIQAEQAKKLAEAEFARQRAEEELARQKAEQAKKEAEYAAAQEQQRHIAYTQYIYQQKMELDRLRAEETARKEAEEIGRKKFQEDYEAAQKALADKKKAEEEAEIAKQVAAAISEQQYRIHQEQNDRIVKEKVHAEALKAQAAEFARQEAAKKLTVYVDLDEAQERSLIREEIRKQLQGSVTDEDLQRRFQALRPEDIAVPPVKPQKINIQWEA
ncbi:Protein of unknown function [Pyronema omphalodes CBS 100304]|uniref:Uncharacterized protein n=1 Tax=Pyronema omphalodes (strain CBS 100304) TaxID=1076935 RepID=U4L3M7_PYROM|nr:Protein of unknown function [Pyronema omphalodes CBS 100304]